MRGFFQIRVLVADGFELLQAPHVLANGDVFHLRGNDSLVRIPLLGHGVAGGSKWLALEAGVFLEFVFGGLVLVVFLCVGIREVAVVCSGDLTPLVFLHITTVQNPLATQGREALTNITFKVGVPPWA